MDDGALFLKEIDNQTGTLAVAGGNPEQIRQAIVIKTQEIEALEDRQSSADQAGSPYMVNGQFDAAAYRRDGISYEKAKRQLSALQDQLQSTIQASRQWEDTAKQQAANFLRGNMGKVPAHLRDAVRSAFATDFNQVTKNGMWLQPANQSTQTIQLTIERLYDAAFGRAMRGTTKVAVSGGITEGETSLTVDNEPSEEDLLVQGYLATKRKGMTLYDIQQLEKKAGK